MARMDADWGGGRGVEKISRRDAGRNQVVGVIGVEFRVNHRIHGIHRRV